ncbi:MAG: formate dehydrogenase accessory sulfurtransferase FdhD [Candidatus Latescibacter sp.]|nr:formate dehydrogenase accessory sulfurtransferase FdhD [Candidatus Latescibacter sp.]
MITSFQVTRFKGNVKEVIEDFVIEEIPLTLMIGDKELVTLLCCPSDLEDLVRGFLFTSGLIINSEEIINIYINREQWVATIDLADNNKDFDLVFKRLYTSGCGKGILFYTAADILNKSKITSQLRIDASGINAFMVEFQGKSEVFNKTGGVHSAALADKEHMLIFKEDIGRHNAIDKVIGQGLREKVDFGSKIMISSGRISSEVLFKTQKCKIPMVISRSAPTAQAVKLARDMGITLVGFARGNRMNIYSAEERIN